MTSAENDDREIRIALIGPNARVIFVQKSIQLIQSTCSTDFMSQYLDPNSTAIHWRRRLFIATLHTTSPSSCPGNLNGCTPQAG